MARSNKELFWVGLAWPFVCLVILKFTTGVTGIPHLEHLYLLAFILPSLAAALVIIARLGGARVDWWAVGLFSLWMAAMGWMNFSFIAAIWDSI